jgi:hypothetical protein
MSDADASPGALQFDRAEFGGAAEEGDGGRPDLTCAGCNQPIADTYYEIGGQIACPRCHAGTLAARTGGSGAARFVRALVFGVAAGAVGFGIYYAVLALTGYEFGLIAIVVGFMVGAAVRAGARHRGGWLYQLMALGITYFSIVLTYVPMILTEIEKDPTVLAASEAEGGGTEIDPAMSRAGLLVGSVILALALPFLAGFENILGLLILGFGLFQAWKLNKRVPFEASGPFQVGAAAGT